MNLDVNRLFIRPVLVPVVSFVITAVFIITIGETLLHLFEEGLGELQRKELWFGVLFAIVILAVATVAVKLPSAGPLDKDVVVGGREMFAPALPPVEVRARSGERGKIADITEGYAVYARAGQLGRVLGIIPGGIEAGRQFRGYLWTEGVRGATQEMWIPFEAVLDVYPETHSVFLAVKGDETETYGWNHAPASFNRVKSERELPKTL
mgnify:CR=1 FL=1